MKQKIINLIQAISIVAFLCFAFILYLRLETPPQELKGYEPNRPVILSDTTNTWPEPDSVVIYENGIESNTYKEKTLAQIEKRF